MTFKVYYQPSKKSNPKRENTHVMYFEAKDEVEARHLVETHFSEYNVEFIEALDEATLEYEKQSVNFKLTEF
ncbi:DNA-directed RNA polymerase subunit epsilon [Ligilactobacillus salivarius]|uniref:DNA-directed RNA polymerase subunit epsilon n=1 Tax=Ligilactobacillus salivarius TaxID=1624 RepID=A0A1V9R371_9LACO|nr:DNA-directed RNA polymerase subunit epsilon [Ligilactobacillus salivarius]OQQ85216.1 hypothetical protein B6U60_02985 [Ligilactobacillus salivarius]OQQ87555.1 hypothetical protein B6U59_03065 [Ligilactobacillus salivarius]